MLVWWQYALWGAFGGVAVEAIELLTATRRTKTLPWKLDGELKLPALALTTTIRLGLGAGLAVALGQASQISGGVGALAVGVAAPLILEQLGKAAAVQQVEAAGPSVTTTVGGDYGSLGGPEWAASGGFDFSTGRFAGVSPGSPISTSGDDEPPEPGQSAPPAGSPTAATPPPSRHEPFPTFPSRRASRRSGTPDRSRPGEQVREPDVRVGRTASVGSETSPWLNNTSERSVTLGSSGSGTGSSLKRVVRKLLAGLARSTPAFGGTTKLD